MSISAEKNGQVGIPTETKLDNRLIKGLEGENHISEALRHYGFVVRNVANKQYCFDSVVYGYARFFWVQTKHKEPRLAYADTGLELWRFRALQILSEKSGQPVLLLFTDKSKGIYGQWLSNLHADNQGHGNTFNSKDKVDMVYFWLKELKPLANLLEE